MDFLMMSSYALAELPGHDIIPPDLYIHFKEEL
jgi:hypothetical protein